jgi:glycosyltransferase involved in cell wall biosynthesis
LICTVKNEEETITELLQSIAGQSRLPDEIILVDGGSSDNTMKKISEYSEKLPIKLLNAPGSNIAQGRNLAIKNSQFIIIASTDGGCKLDENWLENITAPFEEKNNPDCVSGVYLPWCKNEFEQVASNLIFPDISKLKVESFQPSGRSIAFKKEFWARIGGYPEWLVTAEDTLFDLKLRKAGAFFILVKNAIVYWRVRNRLRSIFKQFYNYAKGDGIAFLYPQRYIVRYIVSLLMFVLLWIGWSNLYVWLFLLFSIGAVFWVKHLKKMHPFSLKRFGFGVCIAIAIELGTYLGFLSGVIRKKKLQTSK